MSADAAEELAEVRADVVRAWFADQEVDFAETLSETGERIFSFSLPGERKLQIPIRLDLGRHSLAVHAFVCRNPDENHEVVYRWLLERNLKLYGVGFAVDRLGDIYLDGRLPLASVGAEELDRLIGSVLTYADESFNTLLTLGFASSIRKEWEWRLSRGEPTFNLAAFEHLRPSVD